ncbi:MAG TPA: hypothetical protein VGI83_07115 [Gemmatimonadales bacterium]|jgi:hypothetical protein
MTNAPFDFERQASHLGQRAADRIDVDHVAGEVIRRLRVRRPWWQAPGLLKAAAVLVLLGAGAMLGRFGLPQGGETGSPQVAAITFEGVSAADLADILDSMAYEAPPSTFVARGLHDLTEGQLRELLTLES